LIAAVGCPTSLGQVGVTTEEEIEWIAQQVNPERMSNNPRAATPESLVEVLTSSPLT
jgi:alcohol dehydrogenase class IV